MITLPNGKICMNEQEAIAWLLDNYPIPFQCSADYAPLTEIGLGTIVNPTPAKVKVGSIIFFADSKVSTVVGLTANGFICSDQYNDLVDDIVYVSNVAQNASGHLIVTLSNGDTIDAGLIKQVSGFSINASQHLIVSYNDGTSTDLGPIFNGNISISGNLTVSGSIDATIPLEKIKDANGNLRFLEGSVNFYGSVPAGVTKIFGKWSLSATHLMIVIAGVIPSGTTISFSSLAYCENVPQWILNKLYPMYTNVLARGVFEIWNDDASSQQMECYLVKTTSLAISTAGVTATKDRQFRIAFDLLVDNS